VFARVELDMSVQWMRSLAALELPEERLTSGSNKEIVTRYVPLGVCVGLVPWNYPVLLACGKIVPALVTGNTMIVKPSPFTPACGLKLVELAQAFFPPGVLQGLSGGDDLGPMLTEHPVPAKISFTGSTATGKRVMASASKTLKRVTLELYVCWYPFRFALLMKTGILTCGCCRGGNDPAIVFDDVDVDHVAEKVAGLAFLNSGQVCSRHKNQSHQTF
jgi:acyl-CoA reductase-like NAD-dependent aldehyde dehydrogenase